MKASYIPTEAKSLEPIYLTHPGEVLKDELECRGISQRKLAQQMEISYTLLNEMLNGKRALTPETALLIEVVLDIPAEPLLNMQARYNMLIAKRNETFMAKLKKIREIAAVL